MPNDNNICNDHRVCVHRISACEKCIEIFEKRIKKTEEDMIDFKSQSKITIALITAAAGVLSSALTLVGVIAVPLIRGWLGL